MFLTGMKVSSQTSSLTQNITLTSTNLHESMSAMIGLPNDYQTTKDQYPVVFILDGETYFDLTCKAAAELLTDHAMPPCIVVGITSHHRQKILPHRSRKAQDRMQILLPVEEPIHS